MKYSSSRITMLLIGLASTVSAQAATTMVDAVDFRSARAQSGQTIGANVIGEPLLGDNGTNEILRPVAKFNLDEIRPNISGTTTVTLSMTIDRVVENLNPLFFDNIDLLSLGSTSSMVTAGDFETSGSLIGNHSPLLNLDAGDVITFDVTNAVLSEAANLSSDYIGFRIQAGDGPLTNGDSANQFLDFENGSVATAQLTVTTVPEPSSAILISLGAISLGMRRSRK